MRKLAILCGFVGAALARPSFAQTALLPLPSSMISWQGELPITPAFHAELKGPADPRLAAALARFQSRLGKRLSAPLSASGTATLIIETKNPGLPVQSHSEDESYSLTIDASGARLSADNALGAMHGLETLLQLLEKKGAAWTLPAATIQDSPRFPWRGLMIDSGRHFMPLPTLKRNLDGMAAAKLNVLHWHLSEDQGFRAESKLYPKLQGLGSDGLYYTQAQIAEIVAYARERGIRVVPEFDMPGHSTAWFVGYPELASSPGPYAIERRFGIFDPAFDPSREETFRFLDAFLGEMAALFPDAYFHIGGDENNGKQWNSNPTIQAFMAKKGLRNNEELQAYFSGRVAAILAKHGKRTIGWDEISRAELPQDALLQVWHGNDALTQATARGYGALRSDGYYLDLAQPAAEHYLRDPVPSELSPAQAALVLGGEACMWSELVDENGVDARLWPRCLAVAERLWSPADTKDLDDFYRRMETASAGMEELGLLHRSHGAALLKELAGKADPAPLRLLAEAVSPLRWYRRHGSRDYLSSTPLNRLVDAVVPDGPGPRAFDAQMKQLLQAAPAWGESKALEALFKRWSLNHAILGPQLLASQRAAEAWPLSQDLSALGNLGLEALKALKSGDAPSADWQQKAAQTLAHAGQPAAELELAVMPSMRKLVYAAAQAGRAASLGADAWNRDLDAQVEKAAPRHDDW
jgi:hexosaminidase